MQLTGTWPEDRSWSWRRPGTWTAAGCGVLDIAVFALLSGFILAVATGLIPPNAPPPTGAAAAGVIVIISPVIWRRRWPLAAAAALAAAMVLNVLLFGSQVRCGEVIPATLLVGYAVAARCDRRRAALGLLLCVTAAVVEGVYDSQIGWSGVAAVVPVLIALFGVGRLVQARSRAAEELRATSAELRQQRAETAKLAVLADRAQITADLEQTLRSQIGGIAAAAASGLDVLDADHGAARDVMASIEHDGRSLLGQMRETVGALRESAPSHPQPTLARLPELLATATSAAARLTVEGDPRTLPAGLELSGYRIVEHLLQVLDDAPDSVVDVRLRFSARELELQVSGRQSVAADVRAVLAAATERARLHGGSVQLRQEGRKCYALAQLPLITGHA
jgi:signal transduction histidine kinase